MSCVPLEIKVHFEKVKEGELIELETLKFKILNK